MIFDFSFILVLATLVTGLVWGLDLLFWKPKRVRSAGVSGISGSDTRGGDPHSGDPGIREPILVEYSRSFFPVILIVLLIRSFLFEPFRIPSDSMMPTLLDGDFIFVNKFAYGLRLPVVNHKIVAIDEPHRGDVIVFRLPRDPSTNYIKRLVGLPGDHISVRNRQVFINDNPVPVALDGRYEGPRNIDAQANARQGVENLDGVKHQVLYIPERTPKDFDDVVPAEHYFFMGDNRDNSTDSRFVDEVGFVPERNLVGKAVRIWLNWDLPDSPMWSRIGKAIR